eukprot:Nk52_evm12s233 gene=Nk52_evmTU12s233
MVLVYCVCGIRGAVMRASRGFAVAAGGRGGGNARFAWGGEVVGRSGWRRFCSGGGTGGDAAGGGGVGRLCWSCQKPMAEDALFFCNNCDIIQPPPAANVGGKSGVQEKGSARVPEEGIQAAPSGVLSHFDMFNMPVQFDIDLKALEKQFKQLQRLLHPDKFSLAGSREQQHSALQSSLVNRAYKTLKDPMSRALYLLRINNVEISEGDNSSDQAFLMEIMDTSEEVEELHEALEEDSGDEEALAGLREMERNQGARIQEELEFFAGAFEKGDFENAKECAIRLKYLYRIKKTIFDKA